MCKQNNRYLSTRYQQGAVLITALVMMMIVTIVGVTVMKSNATDIAIHKSMENRNTAFQCAEAAVRSGELWLENEVTVAPTKVMDSPNQANQEVWDAASPKMQDLFNTDKSWWDTNGWVYGDPTHSMLNAAEHRIGCLSEPRFIVELVGTFAPGSDLEIRALSKEGIDWYRITGFSVGHRDNTSVILQTTFAKRFK